MTDVDVAREAAVDLSKVSIPWAEYARRCANPAYQRQNAYWERAALKLRSIGVPITLPPPAVVPPPPPPPPPPLAAAQSWIFMAQDPWKALMYPTYYGIAFTADIGVNDQGQKNYPWPSSSLIQQLRDRGQRVRSWCDCWATPPSAAIKMAAELKDLHGRPLDGWIGEGESSAKFDNAMNASHPAEIIVGNLSVLREDQKARIASGEVLWINELYLNQDPSRAEREDWMHLPVAGRCIASYDSKAAGDSPNPNARYFPVSEYLAIGKYGAHRDSFYDPGAQDEDRRLLP